MAASSVESQRLISVSLGKIAQSRSQKGGINLHKNLLVATVLHKARTACMIEYQTLQRQRQLQFQQQQHQIQQQKDAEAAAAALEFEQKQEQARSAALSLAAFNTSQAYEQQQQHILIPTCVREMEAEEEASASVPVTEVTTTNAAAPVTHDANLGQTRPVSTCVLAAASTLVPAPTFERELGQHTDSCNKENSPPCQAASGVDIDSELGSEDDLDLSVQVVPQSSCAVLPSPLDHLAAATQLAEDATNSSSRCSDGKQRTCQTSAGPTCNVLNLKRQREENSLVAVTDQECPPISKKARLVATRRDSCTSRHSTPHNTPESSTDSTVSNSPCAPRSDSPSSQISNLVSIFNSGFTGLCATSSSPDSPNTEDYTSSLSCDSHTGQYTALTPVQPECHYSRKMSDPSSLSCSSSLSRLDSLPGAIGLVLSV